MFLFLFFVKNANFDQFWKNHKFQKFANFGIKPEPNVDSFGLILMKTFPSMVFHKKIKKKKKKKSQIYIIFTYKLLKLFKDPKFPENSGNWR